MKSGLFLAKQRKKASYEKGVRAFEAIERGAWASLHWNFACEVLKPSQANNLNQFSLADVIAANELLRGMRSIR